MWSERRDCKFRNIITISNHLAAVHRHRRNKKTPTMSNIHIDTTTEKDAVRLTFSAPTEREVLTDALHTVLHLLRIHCKMGIVDSKQFNSIVQTACELEDEIQRMLEDDAAHLAAIGVKVVDYPARSHPQHRKSYEPAPVPTAGVSTPTADTVQSADAQTFKDSIIEISRQILLLQKPGETQNFLDELNDIPVSRIDYMEMLVRGISNNNTESNLQDAKFLAVTALNSLLIRHHAKDPIRNIPAFSMAIMSRIVSMLVKKNHDYGNSFGDQLAEDGPIVFKIRMKDKVSRLKTLLTTDAQVKDESIEDTLRDIIGYCILFLHHTK